jgi:hypothetical protein
MVKDGRVEREEVRALSLSALNSPLSTLLSL